MFSTFSSEIPVKLPILSKVIVVCRLRCAISTVQYSTVQYSTVQYSTVQYSTVQYNTVKLHCPRLGNSFAVFVTKIQEYKTRKI